MTELIVVALLVGFTLAMRATYRRGIREERHRCREIVTRQIVKSGILEAIPTSERATITELAGYVSTGISIEDYERIERSPRPNPIFRARVTDTATPALKAIAAEAHR